jgi:hypothetical protein
MRVVHSKSPPTGQGERASDLTLASFSKAECSNEPPASQHLRVVRDCRPESGTRWPWYSPTDAQLDWLSDKDVLEAAMGINPQIGSAVVRFESDHFQEDPTGHPVFTFPIHEHGEVIDFAAWHPESGRLAVFYGVGFAINQEAIFNPASHFCGQPLRIHRTPLEYLKADRHGIVIINSSLTYVSLRGSGPLSVADNALGHRIRRWWAAQAPTCPEILMEVHSDEGVAA